MTQDDAIRAYMDDIDLQIAKAKVVMSQKTAEMLEQRRRPQSVKSFAYAHVTVDELSLIALERWWSSNAPEHRHLPHVYAQRKMLLDKPLELEQRRVLGITAGIMDITHV